MAESTRSGVKYIEEQTGGQARVNLHIKGESKLWVLRCKFCPIPNPTGATPSKVKMEASTKGAVIALWLAHEATRSHQLEKDRAAGTSRPK